MKPNPIIWCEIYVQDMERTRKFYESVFQVKLQKIENPEMEMWAFPMDMGAVGASGALVKMGRVVSGSGGTLVYFHCQDVAVESDRIVKAGGRIHTPKMSIGQYGSIALAFDTEGNMIGLHMPPASM